MWNVVLVGLAYGQDLAGPDPIGFAPAPLGRWSDPMLVVRPPAGSPSFGLLGVASTDAPTAASGSVWLRASAPLTAETATPEAGLSATLGIHTTPDAVGFSDLHLAAPLAHGEALGIAFGSAPFFDLPVATSGLGGSAGAGVRGLASTEVVGLQLDGNLGFRVAPEGEAEGFRTGSTLLAGAAVSLPVWGSVVVLEQDVRSALRWTGSQTAVSLHSRLGQAEVQLGGVRGWSGAPGISDWRVFLGLSTTPVTRPAPLLDADQDGVVGPDDLCPDRPETINDHDDRDGCPEQPVVVVVEPTGFLGFPVLDATVQLRGAAPLQAGATVSGTVSHPAYRSQGLPELVLQPGRNRVTLALDPLPGQVLVTAVDGLGRPVNAEISLSPPTVPPFELGGDGRETVRLDPGQYVLVAAALGMTIEQRPVVVAPAEPVEVGLVMHDEALVLVDGTLVRPTDRVFVEGSDELHPQSFAFLDELATLVRTHPEWDRLALQLWTNADGDAATNLHLSQQRANNLAGYLYGRGVDRARLVPRGMGEGDAAKVELRLLR